MENYEKPNNHHRKKLFLFFFLLQTNIFAASQAEAQKDTSSLEDKELNYKIKILEERGISLFDPISMQSISNIDHLRQTVREFSSQNDRIVFSETKINYEIYYFLETLLNKNDLLEEVEKIKESYRESATGPDLFKILLTKAYQDFDTLVHYNTHFPFQTEESVYSKRAIPYMKKRIQQGFLFSPYTQFISIFTDIEIIQNNKAADDFSDLEDTQTNISEQQTLIADHLNKFVQEILDESLGLGKEENLELTYKFCRLVDFAFQQRLNCQIDTVRELASYFMAARRCSDNKKSCLRSAYQRFIVEKKSSKRPSLCLETNFKLLKKLQNQANRITCAP